MVATFLWTTFSGMFAMAVATVAIGAPVVGAAIGVGLALIFGLTLIAGVLGDLGNSVTEHGKTTRIGKFFEAAKSVINSLPFKITAAILSAPAFVAWMAFSIATIMMPVSFLGGGAAIAFIFQD